MFSFIDIDILSETGDVVGNRRNEGLPGKEARRIFTYGYGSTLSDLGGGSDVCFLLVLFSYFLMRNVCIRWDDVG